MKTKIWKRIAAMTIVVLWFILIIATLITALVNNEFCNRLLPGLLFTDIVLPVVAYAILLMYKYLSKRKEQ